MKNNTPQSNGNLATQKIELEKRAASLGMRVLKIGKTTCVLVTDETVEKNGKETLEAFSAHLYQIELNKGVWLPGTCLVTLTRNDLYAHEFEAIAASLAQ